jgi:4-hydroxy-4-methyl-2-oxoglutarate aldolase
MSFCGSAVTVSCSPRDNLMLQVAIHYAHAGDVLVVSAGEFDEAGTLGDVLGNACVAKGIAAVVTDSGVRDTNSLRALGLPVFSGSVSIKGTVKETLGPINHPLVIGDQIIYPGDLISGDADGVVVVRQDEAEGVIARSQQRVDDETELIRLYHQGKTTIELCNLVDVLKNKGLIIEDWNGA